jgi:hypothetical protein
LTWRSILQMCSKGVLENGKELINIHFSETFESHFAATATVSEVCSGGWSYSRRIRGALHSSDIEAPYSKAVVWIYWKTGV